MVVLATSCLSVLSSVLVLGIHHQRGKPRRVPRWLRFVVFNIIARIVCVTVTARVLPVQSQKHRTSPGKVRERKIPRSPRRGRVGIEDNEFFRMDFRRKSDAQPPSEALLESSLGSDTGAECRRVEEAVPPHVNCSYCTSRGTETVVIRQLIQFIQTKHCEEMKDEDVFKEWHDVAYVLDRLLFYVFLVITVVSSACILEMRPSYVDF